MVKKFLREELTRVWKRNIGFPIPVTDAGV